MDEKEAIRDIRWNFSRGKSRAEITRGLQKQGLKLEFIDSLISRAKRPKKIFKSFMLGLILMVFLWMGVYGMFFYQDTESVEYSLNWVSKENLSESSEQITSLEITPELISFFASEIGAGRLRRNPLNFKKPTINFQISGEMFYTIVDKKIQTSKGNKKDSDLTFITEKSIIEEVFSSQDIKENVKIAVLRGDIEIQQDVSEQELFLKGYLQLYNDLS